MSFSYMFKSTSTPVIAAYCMSASISFVSIFVSLFEERSEVELQQNLLAKKQRLLNIKICL